MRRAEKLSRKLPGGKCEKMKEIKLGIIGLGQRGYLLLQDVLLPQKIAQVTAVCDAYQDRCEQAAALVEKSCGTRPAEYQDYRELLRDGNVNTVLIACAWEDHIPVAVAAMHAGKAVGMEVGGAYTIEQCWQLVDTYEQTRTPFMFLENCCFGQREMQVLYMKEQGVFGQIVHCTGGYQHDLREEICGGKQNRHYRLRNYLSRNCENYPTHELGPIARILDINHGNRMLTLTSTASCSAGLHAYIEQKYPDDELLRNAKFQQGDVVTTVIKCARGETIALTLDTSLPRFYCRNFSVHGTKGLYDENSDSIFLDTEEDRAKESHWIRHSACNAESYRAKYEHPVWKQYIEQGVQGSHSGMDWLEFQIFFDCLKEDKPMPIDVYDAASWMAITALSEQSIARGSAAVDIPDFTRGKWEYESVR